MPKITISNMQGEVPRVVSRNLESNQAREAENCDLRRGSILPLSGLKDFLTLTGESSLKAIFKIETAGSTFWVTSQSEMAAALIPVASPGGRFHYLDGTQGRKSDYALASNAGANTYGDPDQSYYQGVPAPTTTLSVTVQDAAGADILESGVSYVYTFITGWGEESALSDPSASNDIYDDQYVTLGNFEVPPQSHYNIIGIRIYRVNTNSDGSGEYQAVSDLYDSGVEYIKIAAFAAGTGTIAVSGTAVTGVSTTFQTDTIAADDLILCRNQYLEVDSVDSETAITLKTAASPAISAGKSFTFGTPWTTKDDSDAGELTPSANLGDTIQTEDWTEPLDDIEGIIALSNSCFAAFRANELYISEPGNHFAYPDSYQVTTMTDIVAIGSYETTIVAGTQTQPYIVECYDPQNLSQSIIAESQPCLFKRCMVSGKNFVAYISPDGLMVCQGGGVTNFTEPVFTKEQWRALLTTTTDYDKTVVAFLHDNRYIAFFEGSNEGFYIDLAGTGNQYYVKFSLDSSFSVYGGHVDSETDKLYLLVKISSTYYIKEWLGGKYLTATWASKEFSSSIPFLMACGKVSTDILTGYFLLTEDEKYLQTEDSDDLLLESKGDFTLSVYANNELQDTITITDDEMFWFNSIPGRGFSFKLEGTAEIDSAVFATSPGEL